METPLNKVDGETVNLSPSLTVNFAEAKVTLPLIVIFLFVLLCNSAHFALYFNEMTHDNKFKMDGKGEDMFFLSNGHVSALWYSVLARSGYFSTEELGTFRKLNSRLQGHPATHEGLPGIRIASGSLGQGLSVAIGVAQAKKIDKDDKLVYVMMGDGEQQEGQVWEAGMYAAHHKVDNLIAAIDYNGQQIDGPTAKIMDLKNLKAKIPVEKAGGGLVSWGN